MEDALKSIIIDAVDELYIGKLCNKYTVNWASQPVIYLIIYSIVMKSLHPRMSNNVKNI